MSEQPQPQFHAICIPDKADSLRMPEVISPLPQRILPEIPSNIQQGLANLELEASQLRNANMPSDSSVSSTGVEQMDSKQPLRSTTILRSGYEFTNEFFYRNLFDDSMRSKVNISARPSPFPKIKKNLPNLPLSDQEKGELLESVRPKVLKSTSPEVQLAWAQNALSWVEIETEHAIRSMSEAQLATSKSSRLESQLQKDAINIVLHLAEQSHPKAEFIRAYWFEFGKFGYQIDKKEAFLGYSRAAQNGFPRAQYRIGMQFENSNNPAKAIEHFCKGVAMKDSASHYRLGMMNLLGQHNTPIDYVRGINLLRFAAETADENSPQGSYVYGMLLARELPNVAIPDQYIPCDTISNARMFIEKAAYLGFAKAQLKMGLAYELCQLGCDFDPTLSVHYNALASRQGEPAAEMAISKWFLCGYEGIFEKNEELAFTYAQRAAATQFPMAEFAMGYFFEIGMYVASDLCLSEMWYKKAAEHGNQDALQRINSIKSNNVFSKKDHEQIALNRIKSRFGSQRGERPERLRRHQLSSAPIPDQEELDLQNSRISQVAMYPPNPQVYSIGRPDVVKPRNSYSGPYRSESGGDPNHISNNPASPSLLPPRSSSTRQIHSVPYPIDDTEITGHVPGPGQALNTGMHSDRPHSAFSIRPMTNTNAEVLTSHGRTQASYDQIRSSISMESMPPAGSQVTSVGDRIVPTGRETQLPDYRSTGPQMDANGQLYEYNRERPFPGKPQKPGTMNNNNKPQPPYQLDNYYTRQSAMNNLVRPERVSSANSPNPSQGAFRTPQRYPPQNMPSQQVIQPRNESRPNARPLPSAPVNSPSVATPVISPSATVSVTSPSAAAPKKAGPATFEEMGIPTANKEGECCLM